MAVGAVALAEDHDAVRGDEGPHAELQAVPVWELCLPGRRHGRAVLRRAALRWNRPRAPRSANSGGACPTPGLTPSAATPLPERGRRRDGLNHSHGGGGTKSQRELSALYFKALTKNRHHKIDINIISEVLGVRIYQKVTWGVGKLALLKTHIPAERRNGVSPEESDERAHAAAVALCRGGGNGVWQFVLLLCVCLPRVVVVLRTESWTPSWPAPPEFYFSAWYHKVWKFPLACFSQLSWICPLPAPCAHPASLLAGNGRISWLSVSTAQLRLKLDVLPTLFSSKIQNTAARQLLLIKLTQTKSGCGGESKAGVEERAGLSLLVVAVGDWKKKKGLIHRKRKGIKSSQ